MKINPAIRLQQLPPYPFAALDTAREQARAKGMDIIDLGVGDPDIPTPEHIIRSLKTAVDDPANHKYPSYLGLLSFRRAAADFMEKRFGVPIDPATQATSLIGSKEGLAHFPLAFVDPGDVVLVPDPGYPVYNIATLFAGGVPVKMPLLATNGFLPDLSLISDETAARAKVMFINYPNNPTAACATAAFFADVVSFAKEHQIIVCHDNAYSEMAFGGYRPLSFLQTPGAMDVGCELHSLSKTYNMTGWRIGFAVGNAQVVGGLGRIKTNVDSGVFQAIQEAAITALMGDQSCIVDHIQTWQGRRDVVCRGLAELGIEIRAPKATFYIWFPVPGEENSATFCQRVLEETGVLMTPGTAFGQYGEGFARIALTVPEKRLKEAMARLGRLLG